MSLKKDKTKLTVFPKKSEKRISIRREKNWKYIFFKFGYDFVIIFIVVFGFQYT